VLWAISAAVLLCGGGVPCRGKHIIIGYRKASGRVVVREGFVFGSERTQARSHFYIHIHLGAVSLRRCARSVFVRVVCSAVVRRVCRVCVRVCVRACDLLIFIIFCSACGEY